MDLILHLILLFSQNNGFSFFNKEDFNINITPEILKPVIFMPDIFIKETKNDYINNIDTILNYALSYTEYKKQINKTNYKIS